MVSFTIQYVRPVHRASIEAMEARVFSWLPRPRLIDFRYRQRGIQLVALRGDGVVGYLKGPWMGDMRERRSVYVWALAVNEEHRRMGLGRALLRSLFEHGRARNASTYSLNVQEENAAAIALYLSTGFQTVAHDPNAYGRGRGGLLMVKR